MFAAWRLVRRQPLRYALGGLGAVAISTAIAVLSDRAEGHYVPGIVTGLATAAVCGVSIGARRPLAAWTSHFVRRWPREWYWHPQIRTAHGEVTAVWLLFFAARVGLQVVLLRRGRIGVLGTVNLVVGWPSTIVLLAASYLYGTWRLRRLSGPSVEEFRADVEPPWRGQRRGF